MKWPPLCVLEALESRSLHSFCINTLSELKVAFRRRVVELLTSDYKSSNLLLTAFVVVDGQKARALRGRSSESIKRERRTRRTRQIFSGSLRRQRKVTDSTKLVCCGQRLPSSIVVKLWLGFSDHSNRDIPLIQELPEASFLREPQGPAAHNQNTDFMRVTQPTSSQTLSPSVISVQRRRRISAVRCSALVIVALAQHAMQPQRVVAAATNMPSVDNVACNIAPGATTSLRSLRLGSNSCCEWHSDSRFHTTICSRIHCSVM